MCFTFYSNIKLTFILNLEYIYRDFIFRLDFISNSEGAISSSVLILPVNLTFQTNSISPQKINLTKSKKV